MPTPDLATRAKLLAAAETKIVEQIIAVLAKRMQPMPTQKSQHHLEKLGFFTSTESLEYALKNSKPIRSGEFSNQVLLKSLREHQLASAILKKIAQTNTFEQLTRSEIKYLQQHPVADYKNFANDYKAELEQAASTANINKPAS